MIARYVVGLAAVAACAVPAAAEIRVDESQVSGGALVVTGQVLPPSAVTVGVGIQQITVMPDPYGRFVWIGDQIPPSCMVTVSRGVERVRTGIGACGINPPQAAMATEYGSSGSWRSDYPAPGIGGVSQTTTVRRTDTVRTTTRPLIISPNDPRYAQTEPPHWGQSEVEGARSGEIIYPSHGFYGNVRSKDGG